MNGVLIFVLRGTQSHRQPLLHWFPSKDEVYVDIFIMVDRLFVRLLWNPFHGYIRSSTFKRWSQIGMKVSVRYINGNKIQ